MNNFDNSNCIWEYGQGVCGYHIPDSQRDCLGKCSLYEDKHTWDNKFGLIEKNPRFWYGDVEDGFTQRAKEQREAMNKVIDGVGENAEVVTNTAGGKQSKSPMAMHLVDPEFLFDIFSDLATQLEYGKDKEVDEKDREKYHKYLAIMDIATFMKQGDKSSLYLALDTLCEDSIQQVINIAKILQYGADRYAPNNWRLIPEEEHINHALVHLIADLAGDTQDDHINHALCRLMMAYATKRSADFDYNHYVDKKVA